MLIQFNVLTEHLDRYLIGLGDRCSQRHFTDRELYPRCRNCRIPHYPIKPLQWFGTAYVEFLRNIPLMLIAIFVLVGLPLLTGALLVPFAAGLTALTVYTSAFIAEVIRAGIQAVPAGQMEAARSSGLTYIQAMRHVILPQAIKLVIPPLGNQFLNLVKNSSILTVLSASDLMYQADLINSDTFDTFSTYIFAAAFYLLLTIPLSFGIRFLEQKYQTGKGVEA